MFRTLKSLGVPSDQRMLLFAGLLGIVVGLATVLIIQFSSFFSNSMSLVLAAVAGAFGICLIGSISVWRIRQKFSEQNRQLDVALNNMNQGLCMFDAENRLVVWNERYREMYSIDPGHIWRGCTIRDLLDARIAAGTFPLDAARYDSDLRSALKQGKAFTINVGLSDGRTIAVVNQPMKDGGWVATHEDMTERNRAERELERTRAFLDTIIENVPSPIIVKSIPDLRYLLINRAAEEYLGVKRDTMIGKTTADVMPPSSAKHIDAEDRKLIASGRTVFIGEHSIATPGNGTR